MKQALLLHLRRFAKNEDGVGMTEALMMLPLMLWAYLALFVYWDAYRTQNTAVKATFTISDMLSRELNPVDDNYINGMKLVFDYLLNSDQATRMVVSSVTWNEAEKKYVVEWSEARGTGATARAVGKMVTKTDKMPKMSDGDTVIVVETSMHYEPSLNVGVPVFDMNEFVVTRPRRTPRIGFDAGV